MRNEAACVWRLSACVGEMCRQGLVSGPLSDSGVNNTLGLLCALVCVWERALWSVRTAQGRPSLCLGGCGYALLCLWPAS